MVFRHVRTAIITLGLFTIITGLVYPFLITGVAQLVFPEQSNGSLLRKNGRILGSELIGQPFSEPKYFWGRLSATAPFPYNAGASSGSNLGPLAPTLRETAEKRIQALKEADPQNPQPIPVDLVTASGSGLDPHISVAAALYQLPRVARIRGMTEEYIRSLVGKFTDERQFGFLGEARVNVLKLNLALDDSQQRSGGN